MGRSLTDPLSSAEIKAKIHLDRCKWAKVDQLEQFDKYMWYYIEQNCL